MKDASATNGYRSNEDRQRVAGEGFAIMYSHTEGNGIRRQVVLRDRLSCCRIVAAQPCTILPSLRFNQP